MTVDLWLKVNQTWCSAYNHVPECLFHVHDFSLLDQSYQKLCN